jgi:hypothetical protein
MLFDPRFQVDLKIVGVLSWLNSLSTAQFTKHPEQWRFRAYAWYEWQDSGIAFVAEYHPKTVCTKCLTVVAMSNPNSKKITLLSWDRDRPYFNAPQDTDIPEDPNDLNVERIEDDSETTSAVRIKTMLLEYVTQAEEPPTV